MEKKEKANWVIPVIMLASIFTFVVCAWLATYHYLVDMEGRGTFGDMFGTINALFSGLAFGGMIFAILLQRKELMLQRIELESTRGVLEGQKLQLEAQSTTLKKQNFENTFFQLLRLYNEVVNSLEYNMASHRLRGKKCFRELCKDLRNIFVRYSNEPNEETRINATYLEFDRVYKDIVSPCFRSLFYIIKFADNSDVENKRFYINMIRAQLTIHELVLLFYNALSNIGKGEFKPLIEKYALLKTLSRDNLLIKEHVSLYKDSAYTTIWSATLNTSK